MVIKEKEGRDVKDFLCVEREDGEVGDGRFLSPVKNPKKVIEKSRPP